MNGSLGGMELARERRDQDEVEVVKKNKNPTLRMWGKKHEKVRK